MKYFIASFKWIMLAAGLLTCTMVVGLFAPDTLLNSNFGETISGNVANIIVRNWAALITLIGAMLIYGAFEPKVRRFALLIASISKIIFIILVLFFGKSYLGFDIGTAIIFDSVMVILFAAYLLLTTKNKN